MSTEILRFELASSLVFVLIGYPSGEGGWYEFGVQWSDLG